MGGGQQPPPADHGRAALVLLPGAVAQRRHPGERADRLHRLTADHARRVKQPADATRLRGGVGRGQRRRRGRR